MPKPDKPGKPSNEPINDNVDINTVNGERDFTRVKLTDGGSDTVTAVNDSQDVTSINTATKGSETTTLQDAPLEYSDYVDELVDDVIKISGDGAYRVTSGDFDDIIDAREINIGLGDVHIDAGDGDGDVMLVNGESLLNAGGNLFAANGKLIIDAEGLTAEQIAELETHIDPGSMQHTGAIYLDNATYEFINVNTTDSGEIA